MQHVCSQGAHAVSVVGVNPQAEKRLQVLQKQLRSHGIDSDQKVTTGQSFRLCYRGDLSHLLELTRHYGDSLGSYRRAFKQLRGQLP